jgi:hypothetical protein
MMVEGMTGVAASGPAHHRSRRIAEPTVRVVVATEQPDVNGDDGASLPVRERTPPGWRREAGPWGQAPISVQRWTDLR